MRAIRPAGFALALMLAATGQVSAASLSCIESSGINSISALDSATLKFTMFNRMVYRNAVSGACIVNRARHFDYKTLNGQLCSGATIRVSGNQTPCTLGKFEEMSPRNR
jgi:hypothetical protein